MDMIILAAIAAFIVYRLYVTLGEKTGFDGDHPPTNQNNVVDFNRKTVIQPKTSTVTAEDIEAVPAEFAAVVKEMKQYDKDFRLSDFIENATYAFEVVLEAFTDGDKKTLKSLLSKDVYKVFESALEDRESQGLILENTLVRVEEAVIEDIQIDLGIGRIDMRFVTEQVPIIKNKAGEIIDGNPNQIDQVVDYWSFERNLQSSNPQWTVISTD